MLVVNVLGIAAMAFIIWWFWLWKPKTAPSVESIKQSALEEENSTE